MKAAQISLGIDVPTSAEFTHSLGQVTWLLNMLDTHSDKPIKWIEPMIMAPLMLRQLRVYQQKSRPIAAITWAYADARVEAKVETGDLLDLGDWRAGSKVKIVQCISPFSDGEPIKRAFLDEISKITALHKTWEMEQ